MKKLAVIMSLYKNDRLDFLSLAVKSILGQNFSDFDFYIQEDGAIGEDLHSFLSNVEDSRVIVRKRAENKGLAYSLNELLGIVIPKGYDYIARMDADDISLPDRFEKQIAFLDEHPETECIGTWAIEIKSDGSEYYRKQMPETHEGCRKQFMIRDCMIHPTVMFRRSYIEKAGFYSLDTYFGEDTMMWAQGFAAGCKFANLPEYLFQFRIDEKFFERRRGWKHAKNIFLLRHKVNRMLRYGIIADFWAVAYAIAKMMPKGVLNIIYKTSR